MMKWFLIAVVMLLLAGLAAYIVMAIQSHKRPDNLGLQNGLLRSCPDSPNCVCSETDSRSTEQHTIAPIKVSDADWERVKKSITVQGGEIQQDDGHYLHATFTTPIFRYVDDVELRLDEVNGLIHMRSASRAGHSDFGVNRKRVERIRRTSLNQ